MKDSFRVFFFFFLIHKLKITLLFLLFILKHILKKDIDNNNLDVLHSTNLAFLCFSLYLLQFHLAREKTFSDPEGASSFITFIASSSAFFTLFFLARSYKNFFRILAFLL